MIEEFAQVVLLVDVPAKQLRVGDVGTVVDIHTGAQDIGYTVEFLTMRGETLAVLELEAHQIRAVRSSDIAHVREMVSPS